MEHDTNYLEFDVGESKNKIIDSCRVEAKYSQYPNIRFLDDEFNTYQNAFKYLRDINIDSDNCDGVAVKYRVTVWNNLVQDAHQNVCEAYKKYKNIADTEVLDLIPEKMIKCGKCGSRLNREYIEMSFCPLCHEDLRPLEFKKILKSAKEQYEQSNTDFETKSIKFSKIKWLIKIQSKKHEKSLCVICD